MGKKGAGLEGRPSPRAAAELDRVPRFLSAASERIRISGSPGKLQLPRHHGPDSMPGFPPRGLLHNDISGLTLV